MNQPYGWLCFTKIEMPTLEQQFERQQFSNGYELVNGVVMHAENGNRFQVPPDVLKRHVNIGHFVEIRMDSARFFVHEETAEKCVCSSCNGEMSKPILSHIHPASLLSIPEQNVPSRGWGEDFWVRATMHEGKLLKGIVDNPLVETRLHGLCQDDAIVFHEDHILAVHDSHRQEMVLRMDASDLKELAEWLGSQRG
jgi:hypothetical protein